MVKKISINFNVKNSKYALSILDILWENVFEKHYNDNFKKYIQINKLRLAGLLDRSNIWKYNLYFIIFKFNYVEFYSFICALKYDFHFLNFLIESILFKILHIKNKFYFFKN